MTSSSVLTAEQLEVCQLFGAKPEPVDLSLKIGISLNVKDDVWPVNGLRHPPEEGTSGWFIWAGDELSSDSDFFVPLHLEHVTEWRAEIFRYLALPPGWRFLVAPDYEDVWFDESLLGV
jgi:hypothetical protein